MTSASRTSPTLDALWKLAEERAKVAGCRPDAAFERAGPYIAIGHETDE